MLVFIDSQSSISLCSGFSVSKWVTSLETTRCRIGLGVPQVLTWILPRAACSFVLDLLSFFHANRKRASISVFEMGACTSVVTVVLFKPIKVLIKRATNFITESVKIQVHPLYNLFPNRAQGDSYSDSLLLWAMNADGSEM